MRLLPLTGGCDVNLSAGSGWLALTGLVLGALMVHTIVYRALFRLGWRTPTARRLRDRTRWPTGLTTTLLAALAGLPLADLPAGLRPPARHGLVIAIIVAVAWLLARLLQILEDTAVYRLDLDVRDNLAARRRLTRVTVIRRVGTALVGVLATASVLLTFEHARAVGASVLASAGLLGLVAGIAGRSTLGNLVAGLQIAFAEPIRLDDVVVVEGEWGRIEEITLTYVVVQVWDRRRLVLPSAYFTEKPFQNWTRRQAQIIGTVSLFLDYRAPIGELRGELQRILDGSDLWDQDVAVLQVIDTTESTVHVRALVSADDAPTAWNLRCEVREGLIGFLQRHHPGALPVRRIVGGVESPIEGPGPVADRTRPPRRARGQPNADATLGDVFGDGDAGRPGATPDHTRG